MKNINSFYKYLKDKVSFISREAIKSRMIYFPLCGIDSQSLKAAVTPFLGGDIKTDKFNYLTKPVSREDLRTGLRYFYVDLGEKGVVSFSEKEEDDGSFVEIGQIWHKVTKRFVSSGIEIESLNFIPVSGEPVEVMRFKIKNISSENISFQPTAAIPIFARALSNKHDHEHVTALLNRIERKENGVLVKPTMKFDEEGHRVNTAVYFVLGQEGGGQPPEEVIPVVEEFLGDGGTYQKPKAVFDNEQSDSQKSRNIQGKEAIGALRFAKSSLSPQEQKEYVLVAGIEPEGKDVDVLFKKFSTPDKIDQALEKNKVYWEEKSRSITVSKKEEDFNSWMRWVSLQPVLRRIFGCSFLPDHDYGKGGRGWRDIWQDLLSLILIEPENIRDVLINNFAGVRIDGSNATIIGSKPGEFIADRNAISRVWMDHGVWPFMTLLLYIDQTGDFDILLEENTYFYDHQMFRNFKQQGRGTAQKGHQLRDLDDNVYQGTVLEHILVQHLVQFFNVGEHNIIRLESADWNDGLDMAFDRGESVTFMAQYAGNMLSLADLLEDFAEKEKIRSVQIAQELALLIDTAEDPLDYDDAAKKKSHLFEKYFPAVQPQLSGKKIDLSLEMLIHDLRTKGEWAHRHIAENEKISVQHDGEEQSWFNGYYDNQGEKVEGKDPGANRIRMTLTGQVFPIMSGIVPVSEIKEVVKAVDLFLKDPDLGGYRLNTDFGLDHYMDLGRAFGFAYGTKENGAFFSHMCVMYAYALYKQGLARAGHTVLSSIYHMAVDTSRSRIYPGVPEYFDSEGLGMYHYLTGAASWFVLTELTQVFGVQGRRGDLLLLPKLVEEEFKEDGTAEVSANFAGKKISVKYVNQQKIDFGKYIIMSIIINGKKVPFKKYEKGAIVSREALIGQEEHLLSIVVILESSDSS